MISASDRRWLAAITDGWRVLTRQLVDDAGTVLPRPHSPDAIHLAAGRSTPATHCVRSSRMTPECFQRPPISGSQPGSAHYLSAMLPQTTSASVPLRSKDLLAAVATSARAGILRCAASCAPGGWGAFR